MAKLVSAFSDDALGTMDASGIAAAIASGEISATEAVEAAIRRAEKVNDDLDAIVVKTYAIAREQARTKHPGIFAGVPTFIKDNELVKGIPTQNGSKAFTAPPAPKNSDYVNQFLSTGLNPLGKTTLPEFGMICSTEHPGWWVTRNPWDTDYTTGGSSSGSAAMVASGVVPIAVANDGAGSTRIPASCCGLIGLKPSRGRLVYMNGTKILPIRIIHEGVVTRTVRDTAAFYAAAEKYYRNPALPAVGHITHPGEKRLKIVFFDNIAKGKSGHQDEDTRRTLLATARLLESLGHQVDLVPFPFEISDYADDFLNYYGLFPYILQKLDRLLLKDKLRTAELEPFTKGLGEQFRRNIFQIPRNLRRLKAMGISFERLFDRYDIMMIPVLSHAVPRIGYLSPDLAFAEITKRVIDFAPYTGMQNVTGAPAISIPSGTSSDGLPIGLQMVAPHGQDARLLELAYELEAARPWRFIYEDKIEAQREPNRNIGQSELA